MELKKSVPGLEAGFKEVCNGYISAKQRRIAGIVPCKQKKNEIIFGPEWYYGI